MIVSEQHRYVYIGIPKAGSRSVARWLVDHYAGIPEGYHHAWQVPPEYAGYLVFTVVRNPYDRCSSAWWFRCQDPSRQAGNPMFGWSFDRFMQSVLSYRRSGSPRPSSAAESSMTQKQYVQLSRAQLALRLEAPGDFRLLPFVQPDMPALPHENETSTKPRGSFSEHFSRSDEHLVWDYCAEDFEAFGYHRMLVP